MASSRGERTITELTVEGANPLAMRQWAWAPKFDGRSARKGPWDDEPEKIQWIDPSTGYDCLIVRNKMGALCGYVGVPKGHPLYGVEYDAMYHSFEGVELSVHGGLTFSAFCTPGEPIDGICHIPLAGREKAPYWFGFDCGHGQDLIPTMSADYQRSTFLGWPVSYKDVMFVRAEIADLAVQLAAVADEFPAQIVKEDVYE